MRGPSDRYYDPPDPPVAVGERVDAFELVVDERHLDERIQGARRVVVDEALQIVRPGGMQKSAFIGIRVDVSDRMFL